MSTGHSISLSSDIRPSAKWHHGVGSDSSHRSTAYAEIKTRWWRAKKNRSEKARPRELGVASCHFYDLWRNVLFR